MNIHKPHTIFDIGANVGLNFKYYMSRFKLVIAVEPNPVCCERIKKE